MWHHLRGKCWWIVGILALGCDPPGPAGSGCVRASDCDKGLSCSVAGQCLEPGQCNADGDCSEPGRGHCEQVFHTCQPCASDSDCSPDAPVCAPHWESGLYCAPCRIGNSSSCPAGSWCVNALGGPGASSSGGTCEPADCEHDLMGTGCTACINEHSSLCYGADGACQATLATLRACINDHGENADQCPITQVPSLRGCVPEACNELTKSLDSCLYACEPALSACRPE